MSEKKYELTEETKVVGDVTLHRIRALRDFGNVKAGDLGGWIEKEENLSHEGECWVFDDAMVFQSATVSGDAHIRNESMVCGHAAVSENAIVFDVAVIGGHASVCGSAIVIGHGVVGGYQEFDGMK
jgi:carbonic anhydrase/acetyltransferase-like protein (isoleucine patch superfamily)